MMEPAKLPITALRWPTSYRIISSRFPPASLFAAVTEPAEMEAIHAIESLTNDRLRDEAGDPPLVPATERVTGPGAAYIMASFTHIAPTGGRFNDGNFGAYYTAIDRPTAIAEAAYHRARFLRHSQAPPQEVDMRVLRARIEAELHDLRGMGDALPGVYDLNDYTAGQAIASNLREIGSWGIVYESVRRPGGECVAALRPAAVHDCKQAEHLGFVWNGEEITLIYEKRIVRR